MNCTRALELINLVIDGESTQQQKMLLDFHLLGCSSCRKALRMSADISNIARNLPAPIPPPDLEENIREMLRTRTDIKHPENRFRSVLFTIPAVAALVFFALTVLPVSHTTDSIIETGNIGMTIASSKNTDMQLSSKTGIRTAPLSEYSRQASLISF